MPEILSYTRYDGSTLPLARPVFRSAVVLDGMLDRPENHAAAQAVLVAFLARFAEDVRFTATARMKPGMFKLAKASAKRIQTVRDLMAGDMGAHYGIHLDGTDQNGIDVPLEPMLSITHLPYPITVIEMLLPWDAPDLVALADGFAATMDGVSVRMGLQGMAFAYSRFRRGDSLTAPATHLRYQAAMMGEFAPYPTRTLIQLASSIRHYGHFTLGVTDTGWRTFVGQAFRDRLGALDGLAAQDVTATERPGHTILTAGAAPIWGDVNVAEDIGPYRAAHAALRPAYADRKALLQVGPFRDWPEMAESYLDRLL